MYSVQYRKTGLITYFDNVILVEYSKKEIFSILEKNVLIELFGKIHVAAHSELRYFQLLETERHSLLA